MQKEECSDSRLSSSPLIERFLDGLDDEKMMADFDRGVTWFAFAVISGMVGWLAWHLWVWAG